MLATNTPLSNDDNSFLIMPDGHVACAVCDGGMSQSDVIFLNETAAKEGEKPKLCRTHEIGIRGSRRELE